MRGRRMQVGFNAPRQPLPPGLAPPGDSWELPHKQAMGQGWRFRSSVGVRAVSRVRRPLPDALSVLSQVHPKRGLVRLPLSHTSFRGGPSRRDGESPAPTGPALLGRRPACGSRWARLGFSRECRQGGGADRTEPSRHASCNRYVVSRPTADVRCLLALFRRDPERFSGPRPGVSGRGGREQGGRQGGHEPLGHLSGISTEYSVCGVLGWASRNVGMTGPNACHQITTRHPPFVARTRRGMALG